MAFDWIPCGLCGTSVPQGLLTQRTLGDSTEAVCMTCTGALERLERLGETVVDRARFLDANGAMREEVAANNDAGSTIDPVATLIRHYREG